MFNLAAARARCEAIVGARRARSQLMTDDPKLTLEYLALTDLPAALEALEEAKQAFRQAKVQWRRDLAKTRRDDLEVMNRYADERDGYKALAKLRGEALNNMWGLHHGFEHKGHLNRETCPATSCREARAAIDALPEEAREKERR